LASGIGRRDSTTAGDPAYAAPPVEPTAWVLKGK